MVSGLYANHALDTISQSHDCLLLANFFLAKKDNCVQPVVARVRARGGVGASRASVGGRGVACGIACVYEVGSVAFQLFGPLIGNTLLSRLCSSQAILDGRIETMPL